MGIPAGKRQALPETGGWWFRAHRTCEFTVGCTGLQHHPPEAWMELVPGSCLGTGRGRRLDQNRPPSFTAPFSLWLTCCTPTQPAVPPPPVLCGAQKGQSVTTSGEVNDKARPPWLSSGLCRTPRDHTWEAEAQVQKVTLRTQVLP